MKRWVGSWRGQDILANQSWAGRGLIKLKTFQALGREEICLFRQERAKKAQED